MSRLTLRFLGGYEVQADAGGPLVVPTRKAQALLAYLALTPGQAHLRDKLAALLWADASSDSARNALRQTLFVLRKALGPVEDAALVVAGDAITLPMGKVETDVATFEQAVAAGTPAALEEAAGLYRGDLLAGLDVDEPAFEEWLMSERERLRELALEALARLLAHQRATGATAAAVQSALRLLAIDPLQEAVHRTLMRLYAQLGRRDAALRQYQACVEVLRRELGVEPEVESKELYQEVLRQPAVRRATTLVAATSTRSDPLVGRDHEITRLRDALTEGWAGHGQVVAVIGEPGIGKSRVLAELATEAERRGGAVLVGRAYESEQILTFGPWAAALRQSGALSEPSSLDGLGDLWRSELSRLFPELAQDETSHRADRGDQLRLFEALARLVRHVALARPLLIVLEDQHWADEMSVRFLAFLGRRLQEAPILIAVTVRDDELAESPILRRTLDELAAEEHLIRLALHRLGREDTAALVRLLGRAGIPTTAVRSVAEQVWAASEGNPFMVVETMREVGQGLTLPRGSNAPLPTRVRDMIGRRLDRLTEGGQQLLSLVAVIGREFEFALLEHVAGGDTAELTLRFEELVRRGILHSVGERFDVTHERIREVAYSRMLPPRRTALHGAVARALAALHAANLAPHYGALGRHYRAGQVWDEAVTYLRLEGRQAVERAAHHDARVLFEQALDTLAHLPESRATVERAADLRLDLADAMLATADAAAILTRLREAEALAVSLGDERRLARALLGMTVQFRLVGDYDQSRDRAERALAIAQTLGDDALHVGAHTGLGQAAYATGDYAQAATRFRRNVEVVGGPLTAERLGRLQPPSIHSRTWLVWSLAELGEFAEAQRIADDSSAIARALEYPWALGFAYVGRGVLDIRRGELESAIRTLEPAFELARTWDIPLWLPRIGGALGYAYALSGRAQEGVELLEQTLQRTVAIKVECWTALILAELGEAYLLAARAREAGEAADSALQLARTYKERGHEAWCLRLLGEIALDQRRPDDAQGRFHEAIEIGTTLGMRPVVAHCHFGLAKLYRRLDKRDQAHGNLSTATTMFREMEMTYWVKRAEAEMKELVP